MENETMETQIPETAMDEMTLPESEVMAEPAVVQPLDVTDRLATEFMALTEEFPQVTTPAQVPDCVLDVAAKEGSPLLDAYLRYRWQEEKRVASATEHRRRSAASSAGSLSRGAVETPPEQDAFLRAFRLAL